MAFAAILRDRLRRIEIVRTAKRRYLGPRVIRRLKGVALLLARPFIGRRLPVLATIAGTDKWNAHWYAQHYQRHFAPLRRKRLNILEIGIGGYAAAESGGESLLMWKHYFPRARVFGLDIEPKQHLDERRIRTIRGSQVTLRCCAACRMKSAASTS